MGSKAAVALMRLREIDKKYKHRYEDKKSQSDSYNDVDDEDIGEEKISKGDKLLEIFRPQLNIKIPDAHHEYLDTNSSDDDNEQSVAVRIINNDDKISESSKTLIVSEKIIVESTDQIYDLREGKIELFKSPLMTDEDKSISENLDASKSISELSENLEDDSKNNSSVELSVKSIESSDEKIKSDIFYSEKLLEEKYSDDSFESNSEEVKLNDLKPSFVAPVKSVVSSQSSSSSVKFKMEENSEKNDPSIKNILGESKNKDDSSSSNSNNTKLMKSINNYSELSPEGEINDDTYKLIQKNVNGSIEQISIESNNKLSINEDNKMFTDVLDTHLKSDINDNKKIESEYSRINSTSQKHSSISAGNDEKSNHDSTIQTTKEKSSTNNYNEEINYETLEKEKSQRNERRKKKIEHLNGKFSINKKIERKMKRDHDRFRYEHECIHSKMLNYLEQMKEERRKLNLLWSNRIICPERVNVGRTIKPLDFPNVSSFIRPTNADLINPNPDPNIEILRGRLLDIRQWIKNQYLIYKEHCSVAEAINKKYTYNSTVATSKRV